VERFARLRSFLMAFKQSALLDERLEADYEFPGGCFMLLTAQALTSSRMQNGVASFTPRQRLPR
jgi:hypothetical protein